MGKSSFILGVVLDEMHGNRQGAWRMPLAGRTAYTKVPSSVRAAQTAERGGLDYVFLPYRIFIWGNLESRPPIVSMEPTLTSPASRRDRDSSHAWRCWSRRPKRAGERSPRGQERTPSSCWT
ncbi:hypothetical protein [Nocardioides alkalitolerans]|uniref:hypothetical protein n=1 Tax=Nocardioides alkalitolerans TaxID=281714 RepID=UPI0012F96CEC|nr:hypothetical protein [Nocardioides alkalitolerans]